MLNNLHDDRQSMKDWSGLKLCCIEGWELCFSLIRLLWGLCSLIGQVFCGLFFYWFCMCNSYFCFSYCFEVIGSCLLMLIMIIWGRQTSPYHVINVKSGDECLLGAEDEAKACFNLLVEFKIAWRSLIRLDLLFWSWFRLSLFVTWQFSRSDEHFVLGLLLQLWPGRLCPSPPHKMSSSSNTSFSCSNSSNSSSSFTSSLLWYPLKSIPTPTSSIASCHIVTGHPALTVLHCG